VCGGARGLCCGAEVVGGVPAGPGEGLHPGQPVSGGPVEVIRDRVDFPGIVMDRGAIGTQGPGFVRFVRAVVMTGPEAFAKDTPR
jgi:hypothetical protein